LARSSPSCARGPRPRSLIRRARSRSSCRSGQGARLLNLKDYGFAVGRPADVVVVNAQTPEQAIAEIAQPLAVFKHGKQTVEWHPPELRRPR
jgi:cytosine/creatinine deaminase